MDITAPEGLIEHFSKLEDPRVDRNKKHELIDVVVLCVCAVLMTPTPVPSRGPKPGSRGRSAGRRKSEASRGRRAVRASSVTTTR